MSLLDDDYGKIASSETGKVDEVQDADVWDISRAKNSEFTEQKLDSTNEKTETELSSDATRPQYISLEIGDIYETENDELFFTITDAKPTIMQFGNTPAETVYTMAFSVLFHKRFTLADENYRNVNIEQNALISIILSEKLRLRETSFRVVTEIIKNVSIDARTYHKDGKEFLKINDGLLMFFDENVVQRSVVLAENVEENETAKPEIFDIYGLKKVIFFNSDEYKQIRDDLNIKQHKSDVEEMAKRAANA